MTRASADAPATHFRLSDETWALAIEHYKNGATAREVGAKWMVAPSSVYRQAAKVGSGKRHIGDARARAHARVVEEEEAAVRGMHSVGSRALKGLFSPEAEDRPDAGNPEALMRLATVASGRAMTGRLWAEAKALAGLAESYGRLASRGEPTIETLPVTLIYDILYDKRDKAEGAGDRSGHGPAAPAGPRGRGWGRTRQRPAHPAALTGAGFGPKG